MNLGISRSGRLLEMPLERGPRVLLLFAVLLIGASFAAPLWTVAVFPATGADSPVTYALGLAGSGPPLEAVATGPRAAEPASNERGWIAFGLIALALLFARAAALGTFRSLVDSVVLYLLFGVAALRLLYQELGRLGGAAWGPGRPSMAGVLFGGWRNAGGRFAAFPSVGAWTIAVVGLVLVFAFAVAWRSSRRELRADFAIAG